MNLKKWFDSRTKSEKLRIFLVAFLVGIFVSKFDFGMEPKIFLLFSIGVLGLAFWFRQILLGLLAVFLGAILYAEVRDFLDFRADRLPNFYGQRAMISGFVSSFPEQRGAEVRFFVSAESVNGQQTRSRVLVILPKGDKIFYGDGVKISGTIQQPRKFRDFDYLAFLKRFGSQSVVREPTKFEIICRRCSNSFWARFGMMKAESFRNHFAQNLQNALPAPHSEIAMGVLLGVKNQLPEFVSTDFKNSGLAHLLVVSGFNVTILMAVVVFLLRRMGERIAFVGAGVSLIFFVAVAGAEAPILRAAIMGAVAGFGASTGRFGESRNLLFLAAFIIAIFNPQVVHSDVSFWLSGAATFGIILGMSPLWRILNRMKVPQIFGIRMILSLTISAQIAVLPLLGLHFGYFPLAGFFANVLAEPLVPLAMGFSALSAAAGFLPDFLARIFSIPAFGVLEVLLQIARFFGSFPPIFMSPLIGKTLTALLVGLFFWGTFSRKFSKKFLENSEIDPDFRGRAKPN